MKKVFIVVVLAFSFTVKSQKNVIGKTYSAKTGTTCKEFSDGGGCLIDTYCYLTFEKDSVVIIYKQISYCSPKIKDTFCTKDNNIFRRYKYIFYRDGIKIKDFDIYGKLILKGKKMIGKYEFKETTCHKK
jgi:hypothetical protein